jgi:hypothetical protein
MVIKAKEVKISYAARAAITSLFKAVTLSTDPGHTLGFTASLINASRSALIYKLEQQIPDDAALPFLFNTILKMVATTWEKEGHISAESHSILNDRLNHLFKSDAMMRYDVETYRDIVFTDDLHQRWKDANETYLKNPIAWSHSNEQLADINKQLMEIITRHDLMDVPKGDAFNLDDHGTDAGMIAAMLANRGGDERGRMDRP